jgi:hypothetical protein
MGGDDEETNWTFKDCIGSKYFRSLEKVRQAFTRYDSIPRSLLYGRWILVNLGR